MWSFLFGSTDGSRGSKDREPDWARAARRNGVRRRPRERVIEALQGPELERALAEFAIREARRAAQQRGEVLEEDDDYGDSDIDRDEPVHFPQKRKSEPSLNESDFFSTSWQHAENPVPWEKDDEDDSPKPQRRWRSTVFSLSLVLLLVSLGVEIARKHFFKVSAEEKNPELRRTQRSPSST